MVGRFVAENVPVKGREWLQRMLWLPSMGNLLKQEHFIFLVGKSVEDDIIMM